MKAVIPGKPAKKFGHLFIYHLTIFLLTFAFCAFSSVHSVNGYMYGEEQPARQLVVDKQLKSSSTNEWQDNLPASQIVLKEGDLVDFKIIIRNSGDEELKNITVTDELPSFLSFIFGPAQPNDQNQLSWQIESLAAGEEKSFTIRTKISGTESASQEGTFCLMNKALASAESGEGDEDTASFCLVGAKKLPKAGSYNLAIGTIIASIIAGLGIFLRKFGRGELWA